MDVKVEDPLLAGSASGIGRTDGKLEVRTGGGETLIHRESIHESQSETLAAIAAAIRDHIQTKPVDSGPSRRPWWAEVAVTSGDKDESVLIELRAAIHFAPLHIPQAISLIQSARRSFHGLSSSRVSTIFSTRPCRKRRRTYRFHNAISMQAFVAMDFTGSRTSPSFITWSEQLPARTIIAHLGNGASLCALQNGLSIDTTMGLTPTGGIPMGTRSGDLDPGVLVYLLRSEKLSADDIEELFNHESGLFGLSSGESDVKKLEDLARSGQPGATLRWTSLRSPCAR